MSSLNHSLKGQGILYAALYDKTGLELERFGNVPDDTSSLFAPATAIIETLQNMLETPDQQNWSDMVLDFEAGPILLTPTKSGGVLLAGFVELSGLGRARLAVRKALQELNF